MEDFFGRVTGYSVHLVYQGLLSALTSCALSGISSALPAHFLLVKGAVGSLQDRKESNCPVAPG